MQLDQDRSRDPADLDGRHYRDGPSVAADPDGAGELPRRGGPIIGRDQETEETTAALLDGSERLITLTGPGGVGKTRLAVEIAHKTAGQLQSGAVFVPLAGVSDAADVATVMAGVLRLAGSASDPPLQGLIRGLSDREQLIVLDNFEHLLPAAPLVSELVSACPELRVLVTSRMPLRLDNEHQVEVEPLVVPNELEGQLSEAELARVVEVPSMALLVARMRAVNDAFQPTSKNAQLLVTACRRLGGSPLEIELAAARTRLLSLSQLIDRLGDDPLGVLARAAGSGSDRHRSLRATIQWSFDLLSQPDQSVLCQLSVFEHSFTFDAAAHVVDETDALDALDALADAHLVHPVLAASHETPRLTMPVAVRDFGRDQLRATGRYDDIYKRMSDYFVALGEIAAVSLETAEEQRCLDSIEPELDQIRAVLSHLRERDMSLALRLAADLGAFWLHRGLLSDGRRHLAPALDPKAVAGVDPVLLARASVWEARLAADQGAISDREGSSIMLNQLQAGLATARQDGDIDGQLRCLDFLSHIWLLHVDDTGPGEAVTSEGIALARQHGRTWWLAHLLQRAAVYARFDQDLDRATALAIEAWNLARQLGADRLILHAGLTVAQLPPNERIEDLPTVSQLQKLATRIHDYRYATIVTISVGVEEMLEGRLAEAAQNFLQVVHMSLASGYWHAIGFSLMATAAFAAVASDHHMCARMHGAARDTLPILRRGMPPAYYDLYLDLIAGARSAYGPDQFDRLADDAAGLGWDFNSRVARSFLAGHAGRDEIAPAPISMTLTKREVEVLACIIDGDTNKDIARLLSLAPKTVMHYTGRIYRKLGVRGRAEAAALGERLGISKR